MGAIALQLAKAYGAEVTAVEHTSKLDLVRSLGADRVIDHTAEDFTRRGERWDVVFDVPGNHAFREVRRVVEPDGRYLLIGHDAFGAAGRHWLGGMPLQLGLVARSAVNPQLRGPSFASPDKQDLMSTLTGLMASGRLRVVVDRAFPLEQASDALRHLMSGRPLGRVVVCP
ncbi:zinc-binding dehydrogenase [Aeromicrobium duanguangcaii]|uniref:Zinc-binding dehydrogenase n=1 Tax=Aeromicrobium duanguangcaii TaxID=2968086 RepID=A0ABY5KFX7_9ACTN|nr:zinc-binding dehydrogenase [Aeromicrobium duanguangcaii]MCD9153536.1 zinc-binding dehydrogenase [Aeromicrobium duanguangcaii]UUI69376.1 zinc-binding dehydrogenase [Aeromicrobium duanguangcaii]